MAAQLVGDIEGQKRRLAQLNGMNLLFVSGSLNWPSVPGTTKDVLETVRKHGMKVYAVLHRGKEFGSYANQLKPYYDEAIVVDMSGSEAHKKIAEAARKTGVKFAGAFCTHDHQQPLVGQVSEELGLPGNPVSAYEKAKDKFGTRMALEKAGLATPVAVQVYSEKDVPQCIDRIGFPMIIKPTSGAGSMGVYKVSDPDELRQRVGQLLAEQSGDGHSNSWVYQYDAGIQPEAPIVAETFITPQLFDDIVCEFDVECLFYNGECVYANVVDNWLPNPPYFMDKCGAAPSITPERVQNELKDYCIAAVKALGFKHGDFHMEAWYTQNRGPVLIECNPRVGGGPIQEFHKTIWGVDLTLEFLMSLCGIAINPPRYETPQAAMLHLLVHAPVTGTLERIDWMDEIKTHPWVKSANSFATAGKHVNGIDKGLPEFIGDIFLETAPANLKQAYDLMKRFEKIADVKAARATVADPS